MRSLKPEQITVSRNRAEFIIAWNDGHESIYHHSLLRFACPCAECRGGHEHMHSIPDPQVFTLPLEDSPATQIENVVAVGTYALSIQWQDGHHHGIYTWGYLRALCPCPLCRRTLDR